MRRVIIESPYKGDIERNLTYARAAMRHSLLNHEAPWGSHLLYTQPGILRDEIPEERKMGIRAGLAWGPVADIIAIYTDLGVTEGMAIGIKRHLDKGCKVIYRTLPDWK